MSTTSKLNVLFISLLDFSDLNESNIYTDLLSEFVEQGHFVTAISPIEKKNYSNQKDIFLDNIRIYKPLIGNIQKTNIIEKGISTITLERIIIRKLKKINIKFDLILYTTPPVTFEKCIRYIKKRDNAISYLLLKDIFPQNAIDLGIIKTNFPGKLIHNFFKKKEANLYKVSDFIGCMSPANMSYIIQHNKIDPSKIEVNPNTEKPKFPYKETSRNETLSKYKIPNNKRIFIYGGNFGKPQGVDFIKSSLMEVELKKNVFFVLVGSGTEYDRLSEFIMTKKLRNSMIMPKLPRDKFEELVQSCDVGLIFLDYRFTIPNFPSRLLTYLKYKKPVLMAIDRATDVGTISKDNDFGDFVYSNDVEAFSNMIDVFANSDSLEIMGQNAFRYYMDNYTSIVSYNKIIAKAGITYGNK